MAIKVLVVDDEPDLELLIRQRFRRQVREGHYEFVFAPHGEQALAVIQADPDIEVVLSDINMPVMDGLTLLRHLHEARHPVGTVIVSAYGDMANIRAAMNQGALDFLTKPIDFHDFELTIRKTRQQVQRLREAATDRDRLLVLQRDLQTAAEIQRSFLPRPPGPCANRDDFRVAATMIPARAVGGDFFDYFLLDDDRLALVIGDVSGKGLPAALFMAVCRTLLRALARPGLAPGECLRQINSHLLREASSSLFVTLFYAVLDARDGSLSYSNGGHNPPYWLRADGRVETLTGRGLLVGAVEGARYETCQVILQPGERLFLYTDGIPEAFGPDGSFFSAERLRETLTRNHANEPEAVVRSVLKAVQTFVAGNEPSDDITALSLRYAGQTHAREARP